MKLRGYWLGQFELVNTGVGVGVEVSQEVGLDHSGATGCT